VAFDPTINLGHVITMVGVMLAMVSGWYTVRTQLAVLTLRLDTVDDEMRRITDLLQKQNEHNTRLSVLEEAVRHLQRIK
jgi:hypothetical protein